jgi:hypothetical protein
MEARKFVIGDQARLLLTIMRTTTLPMYIQLPVNSRRRPMFGSTG